MYRAYILYLITIPAVGLLLLLLVAFVRSRRRGKLLGKKEHVPITGGNAGIFFNKDSHVVIIPYVKDKFGDGRAIAEVQLLRAPYKAEALGHIVRRAMNLCRTSVPCGHEELMSKLGCSDWKEFSRGKRNISIHYKDETGIVFNTTRRRTDGGYEFNYAGNEKVLVLTASDMEIGQALLELLPRCRA